MKVNILIINGTKMNQMAIEKLNFQKLLKTLSKIVCIIPI